MKKKLLSFCAFIAAGLGVYAVSTLAEVQPDEATTYDVDYAYLTQAPSSNATCGASEWTGSTEWEYVEANGTYRISRYDGAPQSGEVMSNEISVPNGTYTVEIYAAANLANWNNNPVDESLNGSTECTVLVANDIEVGVPFLYEGKNLPESGMGLYTLQNVPVTNGKLKLAVNNKQAAANWISVNVKSIKPTTALAAADLFVNGADITCLLKNPYFSIDDNGWSETGDFGYQGWKDKNNTMTARYAESWNSSAPNVVGKNIYQDVTLPAGIYKFSAECTAENLNCALYAKVDEEVLAETQNIDVKNQKISVSFQLNEPKTVTLGYENRGAKDGYTSGNGWISIDNCALTYLGAPAEEEPEVVVPTGTNFDFSIGTPVTTGICTYAKDVSGNSADGSSLFTVEGWTATTDGDGKSGGLFAYGTTAWLGGSGYSAPATNPAGVAEGNALGLVACWEAQAQYTQEVEFPAGKFVLKFAIYNTAGTQTIGKNYFGFIEEDNTEHLSSATSYSVGNWTYETVILDFLVATKGKVSVGYTSSGGGGAANPHLFVDNVTIEEYEASDITELQAAVTSAEENHTFGFDAGEYAPYNNIEAINAIAAGKVYLTGEQFNNQDQIDAAKVALENVTWTANTTEVNAFTPTLLDNSDYLAGNAAWSVVTLNEEDANYDKLGMFVTNTGERKALCLSWNNNTGAWAIFGNNTGYTLPLKKDVEYLLSFDYATYTSNFYPTVVISDVNGSVWSTAGNTVAKSYSTPGRLETDTYVHVAIPFTLATEGDAKVQIYAPGGDNKGDMLISNLKLMRAPEVSNELTVVSVVPAGDNANFVAGNETDGYTAKSINLTDGVEFGNDKTIVAENLTYTRALTSQHDGNWQSLFLPFALPKASWGSLIAKVAGNDEKYDVIKFEGVGTDANGDYLIFEYVEAEQLEANTPYIFRPVTDDEADVTVNVANATVTPLDDEYTSNVIYEAMDNGMMSSSALYALAGSYSPVPMAYDEAIGYKMYGLAGGEFRWTSKTTTYLKPFRAFLIKMPMSGYDEGLSQTSLKIRVKDGETDGINNVVIENAEDGVFYDLNGRKVEHPTTGVYIFNGAKVLIRK